MKILNEKLGDSMKENDNVMTAEEVSGLLKVSLVTVRRWTASGYIPHMHLGLRMVRYRRDMIEKWMAKRSLSGRVTRVPEVVLPVQ